MDFGGFWEGKWMHVGTKIHSENGIAAEAEKSTKR